MLSDGLQSEVMLDTLRDAGVATPDAGLPASVRAKHGVNGAGKRIHYFLNYSGASVTFPYRYRAGHERLTGHSTASGANVTVGPWDLALVEED
jgi:beta-galactosidase